MQQHKKQDATVKVVSLSNQGTVVVEAENYDGASITFRANKEIPPRVGDTVTFTVEWVSR